MNPQKRRIKRQAKAGLDDREDVVVHLTPGEAGSGIQLGIKSKVYSMFGEQIRASVLEVLEDYNLTDLKVEIDDKGALDFVIRARLMAAIERALGEAPEVRA